MEAWQHEAQVDTSVLRKKGRPSREVLGARIRVFLLVCAYDLR